MYGGAQSFLVRGGVMIYRLFTFSQLYASIVGGRGIIVPEGTVAAPGNNAYLNTIRDTCVLDVDKRPYCRVTLNNHPKPSVWGCAVFFSMGWSDIIVLDSCAVCCARNKHNKNRGYDVSSYTSSLRTQHGYYWLRLCV